MTAPLYTPFSSFLASRFEGKVQKLSLNVGFSCPNRDGRIGRGGCAYCNNRSFNPAYCTAEKSIRQQLEEGKAFFARKYPAMRYLAYFQAYTNTYAPADELMAMYEEALGVEGVVGLIIGTRPDCVEDELLDRLAELRTRTFVMMEYGVESVHDDVLQRVNRGHTFACAADAIRRTAARGLDVGIHLILGLPGDDENRILDAADVVSQLPINVLKLHQLQIVRDTPLAKEYLSAPEAFHLYPPEEYAGLVVSFLERLRPDIAVERFTSQSPPQMLIAPDWGMKNYEFVALVERRLRARSTWQGRLYPYKS